MNERRAIEDRLRKKQAEIQSLEEKLKVARVYVHALQDILKVISKDDDSNSAEATLKPGSSVALTRDLILRKGSPLHINKILNAHGRGVTREARASLTSSLAAYVRRGEIFTRPAPNTFGLVELGHHSMEEDDSNPPAGFGETTVLSRPSQNTEPGDDDDIPF